MDAVHDEGRFLVVLATPWQGPLVVFETGTNFNESETVPLHHTVVESQLIPMSNVPNRRPIVI
jgi:hypothetical protein